MGVVTDIQQVLFVVDAMTLEDIPAVMSIERTAFPIPWPEQAYRHELLENQNGYFIVVRRRQRRSADGRSNGRDAKSRLNILQRLTARPVRIAPGPELTAPVVGFAGMWMFVDEAHVSTIASHLDWRGHGVGELLLISLLREAQSRNAIFATLEVRVTNYVAQNLYKKYSFVEVGRRKRYYRDNGEDALIMTVENFQEPIYKAQLDALEQALWMRLARD